MSRGFTILGMVEAAGIEPCCGDNVNLLMVRDFGCYAVNTFDLQRRFFSPRVPSNPLESSPVLEIYWRCEEVHLVSREQLFEGWVSKAFYLDRGDLEHLACYCARPAFSAERLNRWDGDPLIYAPTKVL